MQDLLKLGPLWSWTDLGSHYVILYTSYSILLSNITLGKSLRLLKPSSLIFKMRRMMQLPYEVVFKD